MRISSVSSKPSQILPIEPAAVGFFVGVVLCCFGAAMMAPCLVDLVDGNDDFRLFLICASILLFFGLCSTLSTYHHAYRMNAREVLVAVPLTWMCVATFASLPFVLSQFRLSYTDAVFEAVSGLTATGSTVIVGLDAAPRGLLLWRFLLIWFGGFGVVTLALLVLPFLRIGGMQFFTMDLSAQSGKFVPRVIDFVTQIGAIYIGITVLGAIAYGLEGMTAFDAIGHSMAAVATGGFSSHDAGIGFFKSPAIEWTATVQMLLAAMPFVLHKEALRRGPGVLLRDSQVRLFLTIVGVSVASLAIWRVFRNGAPTADGIREAAFNVVSIISTTGFTSQDFSQWGGYPLLLLLVMMLVGGCTGSTAGGVKMFRLCILWQALRAQIHRQIYQHGTFVISYNNQHVPDNVRQSVVNYFFLYLSTFLVFALALAFSGLSFEESLGASATALGGVGPAFGPNIGPCCTFRPIPDMAKWLLAIEMLAGRLEILLLVVPLTRTFWRS